MSFSNPLLLLGLFGSLVPIAIHLIHLRKPRRQPFPAMELLLRSIEHARSRWRLRRFLLLAARVLLLASLSLAASGPMLGSNQTVISKGAGPERVAIVVDASLSMRGVYDGSSAFQRAIREAIRLVESLGPEDQATIVVLEDKPISVVDPPTGHTGELLAALRRLEPSYARADLGEAVTHAVKSLDTKAPPGGSPAFEDEAGASTTSPSHAFRLRVVVFTDLTEASLQGSADLTLPGRSEPVVLTLVDVLEGVSPEVREISNVAVTALETTSVPARAAKTVELKARIRAYGKTDGRGDSRLIDVTLLGGGRELETSNVEVVAGTVAEKTIRHAFEATGPQPVELVVEHDALAEDDVRYAIVDVERQVRTVIVDGSPSPVPKEDEVFYLERALVVGAPDQPRPRVVTPDDFPRIDLTVFDVVVLAGVPALSRADGLRLVEFVESGGGLLMTASEDLDLDSYNLELGRILPRPLRGFKILDASASRSSNPSGERESPPDASSEIAHLERPNAAHGVTEVFQGEGLGGLVSTRVRGYLLFEPQSGRSMEILLTYEGGHPALVASEVGKGRVMVLTTSIDRDLTDLPIRPAFVPLVRRTILHLGRALALPREREISVNQAQQIEVPKGISELIVEGPTGREWRYDSTILSAETGLRFEETREPGLYDVSIVRSGSREPMPDASFAVNVDTRESNLRRLTVSEAHAVLVGAARPTGRRPTEASSSGDDTLFMGLTSRGGLVGVLLVVMIAAFGLESLMIFRPMHSDRRSKRAV